MGPTWCCCELKSRAAWRTWQHSNPTSWKRTGCRGPTQAPPCTIAARWARWARSAAPWMAATAAKPAAAAAASSDRRARDTATDRPSKSETSAVGGETQHRARQREAVYLPARCFSFEIREGSELRFQRGKGRTEALIHVLLLSPWRPYTPPEAPHLAEEGGGDTSRHGGAGRMDRPVGSARILLSTRAEDAAGRDVICPLLFSPSTSSSSPFGTKSIFDDWRCHQNWVENAVTDASILESLRSVLFYLVSFPTIAAVRPHSQEITSFSSCVFPESVDSSQGHLF